MLGLVRVPIHIPTSICNNNIYYFYCAYCIVCRSKSMPALRRFVKQFEQQAGELFADLAAPVPSIGICYYYIL